MPGALFLAISGHRFVLAVCLTNLVSKSDLSSSKSLVLRRPSNSYVCVENSKSKLRSQLGALGISDSTGYYSVDRL